MDVGGATEVVVGDETTAEVVTTKVVEVDVGLVEVVVGGETTEEVVTTRVVEVDVGLVEVVDVVVGLAEVEYLVVCGRAPKVATSALYAGLAEYCALNNRGLLEALQESESRTPQIVTPTQFLISMQDLTVVMYSLGEALTTSTSVSAHSETTAQRAAKHAGTLLDSPAIR